MWGVERNASNRDRRREGQEIQVSSHRRASKVKEMPNVGLLPLSPRGQRITLLRKSRVMTPNRYAISLIVIIAESIWQILLVTVV
jgi:hypothetical protein